MKSIYKEVCLLVLALSMLTCEKSEIPTNIVEILTDTNGEYCTPALSKSTTSFLNYLKINNGGILNHSLQMLVMKILMTPKSPLFQVGVIRLISELEVQVLPHTNVYMFGLTRTKMEIFLMLVKRFSIGQVQTHLQICCFRTKILELFRR